MEKHWGPLAVAIMPVRRLALEIVEPFDGEEAITLMADLDAGATATMPSALRPDLIKPSSL